MFNTNTSIYHNTSVIARSGDVVYFKDLEVGCGAIKYRNGCILHAVAFEIRNLRGVTEEKYDGNDYVAVRWHYAWYNWHEKEACLLVHWDNGSMDILD